MHSEFTASAQLLLRETSVLLSLPQICLRLRAVLDDPEHSRKDIASVLGLDPALSARLLRIVNSAYYGLPYRVSSISQALGILGEQELKNLVLVTSIMKLSANIGSRMNLHAFWEQSVYTAVLARNLCPARFYHAREEYFLAGLLLDVGKMLLYAKEPTLQHEIQLEVSRRGLNETAIEQEYTGTDHTFVGAVLASHWNFHEQLIDLIATHHQRDSSSQLRPAYCVMQMASYFSDRFASGGAAACDPSRHTSTSKQDSHWLATCPPAYSALDLEPEALCAILQTTLADYGEVHEVFCGDLH